MKNAREIIQQYRTAIVISLVAIVLWATFQNETVDNAIGLFIVSGVVPGTHIVLGPDVIMQIVVGIFAAALAGFVVWAIMRSKINRLQGSFVQPQQAPAVPTDVSAVQEHTIWERPLRPVRLPRSALPHIVAPRNVVAGGPRTAMAIMHGFVLSSAAFVRAIASKVRRLRPTGPLPRSGYAATAIVRVCYVGRQAWRAVAHGMSAIAVYCRVYARMTAVTARKYIRIFWRFAAQSATQSWQYAEPKLRQFDAYIERHVKRFQRWLQVRAAHNETLSFMLQLYRQFLKRPTSKTPMTAEADVPRIDSATKKA